jgi:hypothetical protein
MSKPRTEDILQSHRLLLASLDDMRKVAARLWTQLAEEMDAMPASQTSGRTEFRPRRARRHVGASPPAGG